MLEKLGRDILVNPPMLGQLQRDVEHAETVERHPAGAIGLLEGATCGQGLRAVEEADVVEAEEAPLENVFAFDVLAVDPPGEVEEELLEDALQEVEVLPAVELALDLEDAEGRPGVDGRVDVTEVPFVAVKESVSRLWSVKAG